MRKLAVVLLVAVASGAFAQSFERESFLDAESRFLSRNYSLALERYDEFLRTWPDSVYAADARYRRAVVLYRLGRLEEAYKGLSLVETRYRSTKYLDYIPYWKAVIEYDRGELESAAAGFTRLAEDAPDQESLSQALLYLGKASTALGRSNEARAAFERLLRVLPYPEAEPSAIIFLIDLYQRTEAMDATVSLWESLDAEKLDSDTRERTALRAAEAYAALDRDSRAVALLEPLTVSGNREIAIAALQLSLALAGQRGDAVVSAAIIVKAEDALRAEPERLAEFWLRVGAGAFHDGRLDLARSYFQRVMALFSGDRVNPDVPIYLAEIAHREGKTEEAYDLLAAAAPYAAVREALVKTRQAWYAIKLGRWSDAAAAATAAYTATTDADLARLAGVYRAYALYRGDQAAEALSALDEAYPLLPGLQEGLEPSPVAILRAELLRLVGQAAESLELLDALIDAAPENTRLQAARLFLLFEKAQYQRALSSASEFAFSDVEADLAAAVRYMAGVSATAIGDFDQAIRYFDALPADKGVPASLGEAAPWALYYRAYALYRFARFSEAVLAWDTFLELYPDHERVYEATYLLAWSAVESGSYVQGIEAAERALALAEAGADVGTLSGRAEAVARAAYLLGTLKPFVEDWDGAIAALDKAAAVGAPEGTSYTVRAVFEKAAVLDAAGRVDEADKAFALVSELFPDDALADEAAYRRAELLYRAKRWSQAVDRFAAYRQDYRDGGYMDAALYYGGLSLKADGRIDQAILLWERLLSDFNASRYRFSTILSVARAYQEKRDWAAAFRAYTSAIAEFGERARQAGAYEEAETLRYLITGLPEKAARLHTVLTRENGAMTDAGREAALLLASFYIRESSQREAGLPLLDEIIAMRGEDYARATEAAMLKGEYYGLINAWDRAALSYLDAFSYALSAPAGARNSAGALIASETAPEALYRAALSRSRSGKKEGLAELVDRLSSEYPSSPWTPQARRLLEGTR